jgi:hypothetical protein
MPALLIRDGEQPVEGNPPAIGKIDCTQRDCATSYMLRSNDPLVMFGKEMSVDAMRRMGVATVKAAHPVHSTKTYFWKGPELGWLEADTEAQRGKL